jgi:hypothetical protein
MFHRKYQQHIIWFKTEEKLDLSLILKTLSIWEHFLRNSFDTGSKFQKIFILVFFLTQFFMTQKFNTFRDQIVVSEWFTKMFISTKKQTRSFWTCFFIEAFGSFYLSMTKHFFRSNEMFLELSRATKIELGVFLGQKSVLKLPFLFWRNTWTTKKLLFAKKIVF